MGDSRHDPFRLDFDRSLKRSNASKAFCGKKLAIVLSEIRINFCRH